MTDKARCDHCGEAIGKYLFTWRHESNGSILCYSDNANIVAEPERK